MSDYDVFRCFSLLGRVFYFSGVSARREILLMRHFVCQRLYVYLMCLAFFVAHVFRAVGLSMCFVFLLFPSFVLIFSRLRFRYFLSFFRIGWDIRSPFVCVFYLRPGVSLDYILRSPSFLTVGRCLGIFGSSLRGFTSYLIPPFPVADFGDNSWLVFVRVNSPVGNLARLDKVL